MRARLFCQRVDFRTEQEALKEMADKERVIIVDWEIIFSKKQRETVTIAVEDFWHICGRKKDIWRVERSITIADFEQFDNFFGGAMHLKNNCCHIGICPDKKSKNGKRLCRS